MSTGNQKRTYVCVECRLVVRRGFLAGTPACPKCNRTPQCVGTKWRVPKKHDAKGWHEMTKKLRLVALPNAPLYGLVISQGTRDEFKASAIKTLLCSPGFRAKWEAGGRLVRYPRWPGSKKMMQARLSAERYPLQTDLNVKRYPNVPRIT